MAEMVCKETGAHWASSVLTDSRGKCLIIELQLIKRV